MNETAFSCPKCGSSKYGTINPSDPSSKWVRVCHGCHAFTWPIQDDWKHFVRITRFKSKTAFENYTRDHDPNKDD